MNLSQCIPLQFGSLHAIAYGGPYRRYEPATRRLVGVKMAAEIDHPHAISIPTEDFSIPAVADMVSGVIRAVEAMVQGNDLYVGCMGGIGRTGLFMGVMAKLMDDFAADTGEFPDFEIGDPVSFVRKHYKSHAIETSEQQEFVRSFPTSLILKQIKPMLMPKEVVRVEVVEIPSPVVVFPPFWEYMAWWVSGGWRC